jgi:hypothetical protein
VLETSVPGQLKWKTRLPEGALFTPSGIGHVQLDVPPGVGTTWISTKLPREGLYELVAEIEDASPGTAFYLGDDSGKPVYLVGYVRDQRTGQTVLANLRADARRFEETFDHFNQVAPYAPHRHWLKIVAGSGTLKCWISTDGRHWSRALDPQRPLQGRYGQIGLLSFRMDQPRSITLRSLRVQELSSVSELTAPELAGRVPADVIGESRSYPAWLSRVVQSQPAGVTPEEWIRACAIRTLATVPAASVGNSLLHGLLEYNVRRAATAGARMHTIEQVALLFDAWEPQECFRLTGQFERLAQRLSLEGERRVYTATSKLYTTAPGLDDGPVPDNARIARSQRIAGIGLSRRLARSDRSVPPRPILESPQPARKPLARTAPQSADRMGRSDGPAPAACRHGCGLRRRHRVAARLVAASAVGRTEQGRI